MFIVRARQAPNGSLVVRAIKQDLSQGGAGEEKEIRGAKMGTDNKIERPGEGQPSSGRGRNVRVGEGHRTGQT